MSRNNGENQKIIIKKGLLYILSYTVGYGFGYWPMISKSHVSGLKEMNVAGGSKGSRAG